MNESYSLRSLISFSHNKSLTLQKIDEAIYNLEVYIECLRENSNSFKLIERPTIYDLEEFMLGYINLEDKVLHCFQNLNSMKMRSNQKSKIEDLIKPFNESWSEFQDKWNKQMWFMYESIRNNEERLKYMSTNDKFENDEVRLCL